MQHEIEILSSIPEKLYSQKIAEFTQKFGEPRIQKRLGVIMSSYEGEASIDTRIKITNSKIHIVQKLGGGLGGVRKAQEIDLDLDLSPEKLLKLIRMLQSMGSLIDGFTSPLQRYDNRIFDTPNAEVKFYKQFNDKNTFYGFEVELQDNSKDIHQVCNELGLEPDTIERGPQYWYKYDKDYNQDSISLSDAELLKIIDQYI